MTPPGTGGEVLAGRTAAAAVLALLLAAALPGAAPAQEASAGTSARPAGPAADTGATAAANDPRVDSLTTRVASQLRCPVCRSQSVLESSSDLADRMQSVIRERLASGDSPAEVRSYFVDKYGEWILLKPEPEGINLLVYLLPALALVGGGWAVVRTLRKWSTEGVTDEAAAAGADPLPGDGRSDAAGRAADGPRPVTSDLDLSDEDREWLERELRDRQ